jgi:glycosyltransferase involved in cell wall biosynthesis
MKFAYFGFPHLGGTYSVFRHLHTGLGPAGIDLRWLGCGPGAHAALSSPAFRAEGERGGVAGRRDDDDRTSARAMVDAIEGGGFDGVFVNVCADRVQTNVVRYLSAHIARVMIVHNITPGTYAAARTIRDHVHATVGVSDRIRTDLVARHGFAQDRTVVIPNGIDAAGMIPDDRARHGADLRLLYLGRVEDQAKGVFWLPRILRDAPESMTLTIAGDGPDLARLKQRFAGLESRVRFLGAVRPAAVGALLADHDVLLMPSRFEGFPVTLVEAMTAGCVPVASLIRGVTDMAIRDGENGFLFPVGDTAAAAGALARLAQDPSALPRLSAAASHTARDRFGVALMADRYRELLEDLAQGLPAVAAPLDLARWRFPPGLRPGLRTYLPTFIKNSVRTLRERQA